MKKSKWLKYGFIILLILAAGIFYSCNAKKESDIKIELQSQDVSEISTSDNQANSNFPTKTENKTTENKTTENNIASQNGSVENLKSDTYTTKEDDNIGRENENSNYSSLEDEDSKDIGSTMEEAKTIYVHICGEVNKPGVYEAKETARLIEVIKLAGGLTKDAAGDFVNQASKITDGQQIYIPSKEETKDKIPASYDSTGNNKSVNDTVSARNSSSNSGSSNSDDKVSDKININTASKEELMTLTGIGEAKADSILAFREEQGSFETIEEIKNIKGIKDSVFNKISNEITVN